MLALLFGMQVGSAFSPEGVRPGGQGFGQYVQCPPVLQNIPGPITVECDQVPPVPSNVTASSCCPIISIAFSEDKKLGNICGDDFTLTRVWLATDACGNTATASQVIKVQDTTPPFFINPPGDISAECSAIPPALPIQVGDNCDKDVFSILIETQLPGPCFGTFNLTRLWVIRDNCDNANSHIQVITIKDTKPPVFTQVPPNLTISCKDPVPPAISGVHVKAVDDCNPNVMISQQEEQIPGLCPVFYVIRRTFTAMDGCGNQSTALQTITVLDDTPPVIQNVPADLTVVCNAPPPASPIAVDNCDPSPSLSVTDVVVAGGGCGEDVVLRRTWLASDACGNTSTATQLVTVKVIGQTSFQNAPANASASCSAIPAPANVTASDFCGLPLAVSLSTDTLPGNCPQSFTLVRTWTATDPCGNTATHQQLIAVSDQTPPVISGMPMDLTVSCGNIPDPMMVTASDNCDPNPSVSFSESVTGNVCQLQTITRTWQASDACGNSTQVIQKIVVLDDKPPVVLNPPADLTVSCAGGVLPPVHQLQVADDCGSGNVTVKFQEFVQGNICDPQMVGRVWTVTDQCGNSLLVAQMITVIDDAPPVVIAPADVTIGCDDVPELAEPFIADDCDATPQVQYSEMIAPGKCPVVYTMMRTWKVTDDCGNMAVTTQNVVVIDTVPPVLMFVHPLLAGLEDCDTFKIACDKPIIFDLSAVKVTDECDPNPMLWMDEVLIETGPCLIFMKCTFVAKDSCGNIGKLSFYYMIGDDEPPVLTGVPADLTLECDQPVPPPAVVTAKDNCTPNVQVTFMQSEIPGNCPQEKMIIRTWMAEDECGNKVTAIQKITILDTQPPVFMPMHPILIGVNSGDTLFFECDGIVILGEDDLPAKDNCDNDVDVVFTEIIEKGDCLTDGYFLKMRCSWTATDDCGNSASFVIHVIVTDTKPPVFNNKPLDITISCTDPVPLDPPVTATDNCDGDVPVSRTSELIPGQCPQEFCIVTTWTATDDCGNEAVCTRKITVVDNQPPVFSNVPAQITVECSDLPGYDQPEVSDNCDPNPVVTFSEKKADGPCEGEYLIIRQWTATDACGNTATANQIITVRDTEAPIWISFPADITASCDDIPAPAEVKVVDDCDPEPTLTLTESILQGNCPDNYVLVRTWTATDDCGNSTARSHQITVRDLTPPVLSGVPASLTIECDQPLPNPGNVTATDNCDPAPVVTLTTQTIPGNCPQAYTLIRTWTATDRCGNTATASQSITVRDTQPPVFVHVPGELHLECDQPIPSDQPEVKDNCDDNPSVVLSETKLPGACPQEFTLIRRWIATDACGNSSSAEQVIKVKDTTPPVIMTLHPGLNGVESGDTLVYECDDVIVYDVDDVKATDNCDPDPTVTFHEVVIKGDCIQDGFLLEMHCTWIATDDCGNSSSFHIVVRIVDNTPPVITGVPADLTLECDQPLPNPADVSATDNCDEAVTVTYEDKTAIGNCKHNYVVTRTWTATDDCGNTATAQQKITVRDTQPPVISGVPADLTLECDQPLPNPADVTVTDNCDPDPEVSYKEAREDGDCPQEYILLRIWTAEDDCGNVSAKTQKITVVDTKAPVLVGVPADLTVECDDVPPPAQVKAVDNCDPDPVITYEQKRLNGNCPDHYTLFRTWTATDACGNSTVATQKITVQDIQAPVFTKLPVDMTLACDQPWPAADFEVEDNCSDNLTITIVEEGGKPCDAIEDRRIITVTDECGNTAVAIQRFHLIDTVPPVFKPFDNKVEVSCEDVAELPHPEVMDNCDDDVSITFTDHILPGGCPQEYTLVRTWKATDDCGNTSTALQLLVVKDNKAPELVPMHPFLEGIPDGSVFTLDCTEAPALDENSFKAVDNCDDDPTVTFEEELTSGDCLTDGYFLKMICTWTATDACGNSSSFTITFFITDKEAPEFTFVPANVTLECDTPLPQDDAIAKDNCTSVTISRMESRVNHDCGFEITRTWTATDECGNSATASQVIRVTDTTAPYFTVPVQDLTVDLDKGESIPAPPVVMAADDCGEVTVTYSESETPGSDCGYLVIRAWTATDECGNTASVTQRITVLKACPCVLPEIDTVLILHPDCGEKNGAITVVTAGDPSQYQYLWIPALGNPNAIGNGRSGLGHGTYTIFVEDPTAQNCITKVSVNLENQGSCLDTVYVTIPMNDPFTLCLDQVLDFPGNVGEASICGQDANVTVSVTDGSACVVLDPATGFTGTAQVCVIHCNDEVPAICDTTIIIITINAAVPCDPIFTNSAYQLGAPDCASSVRACLQIPHLQVADYQILVNGEVYAGPFEPCGNGQTALVLGVGEHEVEITHLPSSCFDSRIMRITCPDSTFLIAVDDAVSTRSNRPVNIPILLNDIIPAGQTVNSLVILNQPVHGRIEVRADRTVVYTPNRDYCGQDMFVYEICTDPEICDDATVLIDVNCTGLVIHTGFSPNGDGINDFFAIEGIEDYPNNEVTVFNRWGNQVFFQKGYKNNWDGQWDGSVLPDGTYFYFLKDGEGGVYSGFVQIHR